MALNYLTMFEDAIASGNNDLAQSIVKANPETFANYDFSNIGAGVLGTDPTSGGLVGNINETLGTNMTGGDLLKGAMGVGQLGLGVLSYLDQKKTAGKQRELMGQQIAQNKFLLDQAKGRQADISKAFGGSGLAASSV